MKSASADLTAKLPSLTELVELAQRSHSNRAQQRKTIERLHGDLVRRRQEIESSLRHVPEPERSTMVRRATSAARSEIKARSDEERTALLRHAGEIADLSRQARRFYDSPTKVLLRCGLGSERRSRLAEQLRGVGVDDLAHLAEVAASTNDRDLAAVLVSAVRAMAPSERPFNPTALAEKALGSDWTKAQEAMAIADRSAQEVINEDRQFLTGTHGGPHRIAAALRKSEETGELDDDLASA